jgi:hypothetical protein
MTVIKLPDALSWADVTIHCTAGGVLYILSDYNTTVNGISMWKSSNGTSWTNVAEDSSVNMFGADWIPDYTTLESFDSAIDNSGIIHIIANAYEIGYPINNRPVVYGTFNTSTDSFSGWTGLVGQAGVYGIMYMCNCAICVDPDGHIHMLYHSANDWDLRYTYKNGASWGPEWLISTENGEGYSREILVLEDDVVHIIHNLADDKKYYRRVKDGLFFSDRVGLSGNNGVDFGVCNLTAGSGGDLHRWTELYGMDYYSNYRWSLKWENDVIQDIPTIDDLSGRAMHTWYDGIHYQVFERYLSTDYFDDTTYGIAWRAKKDGYGWSDAQLLSSGSGSSYIRGIEFDYKHTPGNHRINFVYSYSSQDYLTGMYYGYITPIKIVESSFHAYTRGRGSKTSRFPACIVGGQPQPIITRVRLTVPLGAETAVSSFHAFMKTNSANAVGSFHSYTRGRDSSASSFHAYLYGSYFASSSFHGYIKGRTSGSASQPAFIAGGIGVSSSYHAYMTANELVRSHFHAFIGTHGQQAESGFPAYIAGEEDGIIRSQFPALIVVDARAPTPATDHFHAYIAGSTVGLVRSSFNAYLNVVGITPGSASSSFHAYICGAVAPKRMKIFQIMVGQS